MARSEGFISFKGGKELDRILSKLDPNVSSRIINSSLKKGHEVVRDSIISKTPTAQNKVYKNPDKLGSRNKKNKGLKSRIHKRGTLRKAIRSRVSGRARPNSDVFIASVYINDGGTNPNEDGWYANFVMQDGRGTYDGMKYKGNNFMKKGAIAAQPKFIKIMEVEMLKKLTRAQQKMINKLNV